MYVLRSFSTAKSLSTRLCTFASHTTHCNTLRLTATHCNLLLDCALDAGYYNISLCTTHRALRLYSLGTRLYCALDTVDLQQFVPRARYPIWICGLTKNCGHVRDMVDFLNRGLVTVYCCFQWGDCTPCPGGGGSWGQDLVKMSYLVCNRFVWQMDLIVRGVSWC